MNTRFATPIPKIITLSQLFNMDSHRSRILLLEIFFLCLSSAPSALSDVGADGQPTAANINPLAVAAANLAKPLVQSLPSATPATSVTGAPVAAISPTASSAVTLRSPAGAATTDGQSPPSVPSSNDDPIVYLDYSTINDEVLRKGTANFVYFNANFNHCRHCHKFFQLWKELAIDIRWWRQAIRLFAINCSDEDNIDMCRRAGVTQFPQVKYYWVMSNSLDRDGQRLRILGKSVHAMRHLIMDKVLDSYTEHNRLLAQKAQQQKSASTASANPALTLFASSMAGGSSSSPATSNPLAAFMGPMLGQLMAGGGSNTGGSASHGAGGGGGGGHGGLMSLMGSLTGGSPAASSTVAPPKNPLANLAGLVGQLGGLQGVSQLIGTLMGGNSMKQRMIQPLASYWPELRPIEWSNSIQLIDSLPLDAGKNYGALLMLETQEFMYTGLEVTLDLNPYANQTHIARVRDESSQLSRNLTKRDDIQAPTLIYITPMKECRLIMTAPKYTNDEDLRRAFVRGFERRQVKYPVKRVWTTLASGATGNSGTSDLSQEDEDLLAKVNQVHMNDLTNALRVSLMEQVFRHSDLSDDQYNALVKYVYAVINYFPFNNEEGLKFVKRLHSWLQNQVSLIDIGEYKKQFHDIDDYIPQRDWIGCKSLSNTKSIPTKSKKSGSFLFENPAQFGKVVSNLTRLFRNQQQQVGKLKNLFSAFTSSTVNAPVMLSNQGQGRGSYTNASATTLAPNGSNKVPTSTNKPQSSADGDEKTKHESPIERLLKSLTSGSLGSNSSILKLISTALTGAGDGAAGNKSKFAREYPCAAWKLAHAMIVNEYIKDSPRKDVKHIVLHSLYQYMLHFYACSTCGNRVSDVSGEFRLNLDSHLQDQGDSVILLWKVHNRVSRRLESENRPHLPPKVQFPSETLCPKCRAPRGQSDFVSTPNWHDKQVLNFLVHHYRPQSLISVGSEAPSSSSSSLSRLQTPELLPISHCFGLLAAGLIAFLGTKYVVE